MQDPNNMRDVPTQKNLEKILDFVMKYAFTEILLIWSSCSLNLPNCSLSIQTYTTNVNNCITYIVNALIFQIRQTSD